MPERRDLERDLTAMFAARADDVAASPGVDPTEWPEQAPRRRRVGTALLAAAAVLLLAAAGSTVATVRRHGHTEVGLTPTSFPFPSRSCTVGLPTAWQAAAARHMLTEVPATDTPVSIASDGTVLIDRVGVAGPEQLRLVDTHGAETVLWTTSAAGPQVAADPAAAVSDRWVVWTVDTAGQGEVRAYDRTSAAMRTLRTLPTSHFASDAVVVGDTAYWIDSIQGGDDQRFVTTDLRSGRDTASVPSRLASAAARLYVVDGHVVAATALTGAGVRLQAVSGGSVPAAVNAALGPAVSVTTANGALTWVDRYATWRWHWNEPRPRAVGPGSREGDVSLMMAWHVAGPLLVPGGSLAVVDTRSGAYVRVELVNLRLVLASADSAVFTFATATGSGVSVVPFSALPAAHC